MTSSDRPDTGDLELVIYALRGIFHTLEWIDQKEIHDGADRERKNTRHELILAGQMVAQGMINRF